MMPGSHRENSPSGIERAGDRNFGRRTPIVSGLRLLVGYLNALPHAIAKDELRFHAAAVIPSWEEYVRGIIDHLHDIEEENDMSSRSAYESLSPAQRDAVIASIRRNVERPGMLEDTPDELLLPILHCLTGRTGDLIRHVSATASRHMAD